jgi:hypothetical protein
LFDLPYVPPNEQDYTIGRPLRVEPLVHTG